MIMRALTESGVTDLRTVLLGDIFSARPFCKKNANTCWICRDCISDPRTGGVDRRLQEVLRLGQGLLLDWLKEWILLRGAESGGSRDLYGILSRRAGFRSKGQDRSDGAVLDLRSGFRRDPVA